MEYTKCWLQYHRLSEENDSIVMLQVDAEGMIIQKAVEELIQGFDSLYGRKINLGCNQAEESDKGACIYLKLDKASKVDKEGYQIDSNEGKCIITASTQVGILYGVFALLRELQVEKVRNFDRWYYTHSRTPVNPLRMINHWDNMDGSIERGYSGKSFFFTGHEIIINDRTRYYARLLASIGINALTINNVNVRDTATQLISMRYYSKLQELINLFTDYGIKLYLSINFAAPMELGGLNTADPHDNGVIKWWKEKAQEIWDNLPGFGGFLVKADSEGRPGPFTYGRTHADGANMLADAVRPYGGIVIWRCFVYNCQQDWRDHKTDRARAGYDNFMPLDGMFLDNVILQIKNGPMDFQVREPVSPLFFGLKKTNMILEVQIAQEYTGQQRHVCYLMPWFKEILGFHTHGNNDTDTIAEIVSGKAYRNSNCGIAAVTNTGNDLNWTGHDLAASNLYGFGRLAYDTELSAEDIAKEWISLTFGDDEKVIAILGEILLQSWTTYEKYTAPLGIGWMVKPNVHYGPDVDGYEYDRWGTYHRADHKAIGVDRTGTGTGFCLQYPDPLASIYGKKETCPQELILFFHRLEYNEILPSGKTVIQHIYNTHFEGVEEVEHFLKLWQDLKDKVETGVYHRVLERLLHQREHAKEWRDVINSYFYRKTGIQDLKGRTIY